MDSPLVKLMVVPQPMSKTGFLALPQAADSLYGRFQHNLCYIHPGAGIQEYQFEKAYVSLFGCDSLYENYSVCVSDGIFSSSYNLFGKLCFV